MLGLGKWKGLLSHILDNQTPKTMREEDDRPDGLIFLISFVD